MSDPESVAVEQLSIPLPRPPAHEAEKTVSLPGLQVRFARTPEELRAVLEVRRRVFRDEQHIVADDVADAEDRHSLHALALIPEGAVGTGRLTPPTPSRPEAQISWVATLPDYRGRGVGTAVMHALLAAADAAGMSTVVLSAQIHAVGFYRRFGFVPYGNRFTVRGIEHQAMVRRRPR